MSALGEENTQEANDMIAEVMLCVENPPPSTLPFFFLFRFSCWRGDMSEHNGSYNVPSCVRVHSSPSLACWEKQ